MKKAMIGVIALLWVIGVLSPSYADWHDVHPSIQQIEPVAGALDLPPQANNLTIVYFGDSLAWAAAELAHQLSFVAVEADTHSTLLAEYCPSDVVFPNGSNIRLGMWSTASECFQSSGEQMFQLPPENEGYYIWIEYGHIYLTASTLRGMNYAVTSFSQALDVDTVTGDVTINQARIKDFPTSPRRVIGDPYDIRSTNSGPWTSALEHADGILSGARELLLENKGNGLIQFGSTTNLTSSVADTAFSRLRNGDPSVPHADTWDDLKMEWYQGTSKWGADANDVLLKRGKSSALVCKDVTFDHTFSYFGTPAISLKPVETEYDVPNFDFQSNSLINWPEQSNFSVTSQDTNYFARSSSISGSSIASISRYIQLQDTVGIPMRELVLEFRVRMNTGDSAEVWIESLMPPDSNGLPITSEDSHIAGDFRNFDSKHSSAGERFKHKISSTDWETLHVLFLSYGMKWDYFTFNFRSLSGSAQVDFDGIRLKESEVYFLTMIRDQNRNRPMGEYAYLEIDSLGDSVFTSSADLSPINSFEDHQYQGNFWSEPIMAIRGGNSVGGRDLLDLLDSNGVFTGKLFFHALCTNALPAFFDTLEPLQPFSYAVVNGDSVGNWSDDVLDETNAAFWKVDTAAMNLADNVEGVHSLWDSLGPDATYSGYFNRSNEHRHFGWSQMEEDTSNTYGWTLADMYMDFNGHVADEINTSLAASKPLLLYSDMFNPYHNGQLITRVNNPFSPLNGYDIEGSTNFSTYSESQPLVFVDWWSKNVANLSQSSGIVDAYTDILDPTNGNWEAIFTYLPETRVNDDTFMFRAPLYMDIALTCSLRREVGYNFSGGGLLYDVATMSPDWAELKAREEFLQLWWKNDPVTWTTVAFDRYVTTAQSSQSATYKCYPVPYPDDSEAEIDSVVFQYRFSGHSTWSTQSVELQSDSLYDFILSLPDSGGYVQYRVWAFDDLGRYGSNPPYGTKWTDPDAGESSYFTFERRKITDIVKADTLWLPGVISKKHVVGPNGKLVFQPLPGYKHATLYVTNDAEVTATWLGTGNAKPEIVFNGSDTSFIHVKPLCDTCKWKGILDSFAVVEKKYVTFHEGTGKAMVLKDATGDAKLLVESAAYEDTVLVKGDAEISGTATFNKLIVDSGATLTILPGSELSFFEGGQLLVRDGGQLKALGNDSTSIVFKADVDSLPWEGIHCEVAREVEACSLEYVSVSGAIAGLLVDRGRAHVKNSTFENNSYGVMVNNGGWLVAENCSLSTNGTGLLATNLSSVELTGVVANQNTGVGVKALSRSSLYLSDCLVNENDGDGLAGGIGLYTGSSAFMECTEIDANTGSGITAYGGTLMLTSVEEIGDTLTQWHGNRIEHNVTIPYEGQITLRDRVALALWNGHNCIQDTSGAGKLIHWEDQVGSDRWADTYWGSLDTAAIKTKLSSSVTLVRIDSSASSCPTFAEDNSVSDTLVQIFLEPHNSELSGYTSSAESDYKSIIRNSASSDYAFTACDRLLNICLLDNKDFRALADTFEVLYGNTSSTSLKRWLKGCRAWSYAEDEDIDKARGKLDSLAQSTPTRFDRVSARVQLQMLEIRSLDIDTTAEYKASDCIAYLDSTQKILELMKVWTNTTISDSVVMYAPTTVEGLITISQPNGRLTILPHPGAEDATVRFVSNGGIQVNGSNGSYARGRLYVHGEADNRVNLIWDSSSAYGNIYSTSGYVDLKHVNLTGTGWVNINEDPFGYWRTPIFNADSCTFSGFDEGLWLFGATDSCEIKNCTFEELGGGAVGFTGMDGSGLSMVYSSNVVIENCDFVDNADNGIYGYYCDNIDVSEADVSGSGDYGLLAWESANFDVTCSKFHGNGDTLAEIWVEDGLVNLVGGHTQISDSDGVLIYSGDASYTDIEDGENSFELLDGTGYYLKLGDTTATWDVTYNAWAPLTPADSGFFSKLYPSTPSKWTIDSSLAAFIECGGGGTSSLGDQNLIVVGEDETSGTFSTESDGLSKKSSSLSKSTATAKSGLVAKSSKVIDHHTELAKWREFKDASKSPASRQTAIAIGKLFLNEHPNSPLVPAAVVQLTSLAKRSNGKSEISSYLAQKALTTKNESVRALFTRKAYVAKAFEGNPSDALTGLEGLLETSLTKRDSICALADAIGIYAAFKSSHDLTPKHDFVKTATLPDLKHRIRELSRQLDGGTLEAAESEVPIPTSYALYQNYPNPFNPTTEIRFDLPEAVRAELKVFNILGQEVVTLVDDIRNAGAYRILWDGKNAAGLSVASGVYIYQLKTPSFTNAKKMMLLR